MGSIPPTTRPQLWTTGSDLTQVSSRITGPLPWLPGIPTGLLDDPYWKTYLSARYVLTRELAQETRLQTASDADVPPWARQLPPLAPGTLADISLWRAAHGVPDTDLRPTGPAQHSPAEARTQRHLDHRIDTAHAHLQTWIKLIGAVAPGAAGDPRLPALAHRVATLSHTRQDVGRILTLAARQEALPDEHPADALSYRITALVEERDEAQTRGWERTNTADRPRPPRPEHRQPQRPDPRRGVDI